MLPVRKLRHDWWELNEFERGLLSDLRVDADEAGKLERAQQHVDAGSRCAHRPTSPTSSSS